MDLAVIETGNGGDIQLKGNDLAMYFGWENMPYLGIFGGNVASVTKPRQPSEQATDWWGNSLLMPNDSSLQFNSETEKLLNNIALNSAGRILIENIIKKDLQFMAPFAIISVSVTIIATDKVRIAIGVQQPDNLQDKQFIYIWDATKGQGYQLKTQDIGDFRIDDFNNDFNL